MKKKYLTYASVISAVILLAMFLMIFLIKSPILFLVPVITIDPISDLNVDENNILILSGKTNLPEDAHIFINVYPSNASLIQQGENRTRAARGDAWITTLRERWNSWNGTINISPLDPGGYQVVFKTIAFRENGTKSIESGEIASVQITIGNDTTMQNSIRKRKPVNRPFIRINPVSGDQENLEINGITDLAPKTPFVWSIEETGTAAAGGLSCLQGTGAVIPGGEEINRWSCMPDTSCLKPGSYRITVSARTPDSNQTLHNQVSGSREFVYPDTGHTPALSRQKTADNNTSRDFITIDTLPDMKINDRYIFSGTTSLPPGKEILFQVYTPNVMKDYSVVIDPRDKSETGRFSGVAGCTLVENGSPDNLWEFEFDTYFLPPGQYEVNVSSMGERPDAIPIPTGNISHAESFILHG